MKNDTGHETHLPLYEHIFLCDYSRKKNLNQPSIERSSVLFYNVEKETEVKYHEI